MPVGKNNPNKSQPSLFTGPEKGQPGKTENFRPYLSTSAKHHREQLWPPPQPSPAKMDWVA